jgi:hypothetical protein
MLVIGDGITDDMHQGIDYIVIATGGHRAVELQLVAWTVPPPSAPAGGQGPWCGSRLLSAEAQRPLRPMPEPEV